ncbi:P-loop containing nucleoside triphosphate hydrolase protein [Gigaspora margarita]|uniref:P-loop containing nucleoside triphosphate hydrolase protein n=1 Tax=Gigaspora margarita TaxID=4874 RepID=A0A8H3X7A2_GIGMA|nr:P-loop containing nucleoside triphosphate hydrolase protein [Gigaspora margarita]
MNIARDMTIREGSERRTKQVDVAVIDEIQMISDQQRGWVWIQALLGLQAKEIHICGEPSAVPLVKSICQKTRSQQAKLSNDSNSGFDVLVASDAIGGFEFIKQIAGRAGRFGIEDGTRDSYLKYVHQAIDTSHKVLEQAKYGRITTYNGNGRTLCPSIARRLKNFLFSWKILKI